jgi:glycerate kinase
MTDGYRPGMRCFCCHGERHVTEMTDGTTSHTVCDDCREMVTAFFHVYQSLATAVLEVARAKRGNR